MERIDELKQKKKVLRQKHNRLIRDKRYTEATQLYHLIEKIKKQIEHLEDK